MQIGFRMKTDVHSYEVAVENENWLNTSSSHPSILKGHLQALFTWDFDSLKAFGCMLSIPSALSHITVL